MHDIYLVSKFYFLNVAYTLKNSSTGVLMPTSAKVNRFNLSRGAELIAIIIIHLGSSTVELSRISVHNCLGVLNIYDRSDDFSEELSKEKYYKTLRRVCLESVSCLTRDLPCFLCGFSFVFGHFLRFCFACSASQMFPSRFIKRN